MIYFINLLLITSLLCAIIINNVILFLIYKLIILFKQFIFLI